MSTKINLLPWRDEERQRKTKAFTQQLFLGAVLVGSIVFYTVFFIDGQIDYQNRRNQYLQVEIDRLKAELIEIGELENTKQQLLARTEIIQQLQTRRPQVVHVFYELANALPEGVKLTAIEQQQDTITLQGKAESNSRVSAFMRNLHNSEWFTEPRLDIIEANADKSVSSFTLQLEQANPQISKQAQ